MSRPVRTLLVWCPDWPVVAAEIVEGVPAHTPVAVLHANRVVACSQAARAEGIRRGLRKREAQSRCTRLTVVEHDPGRDARAFEGVVAAVEQVAAGVAVVRPGACALVARGPARYFGGEEAAAERIVEHIAQTCAVESQVGIADGLFAADLAARAGRIVPPGGTPEFLAGIDVTALDRPPLTDLLRRLGVRTLGDFAALSGADVLARFGFDAALAHRLAGGHDHRPLAPRQAPPDLVVTDTYDEPLLRVDAAAFAARALAERLHTTLAGYGLACTRLGIEAVTGDGQELHRVWRHDGRLTAAAIVDRVRWQLDGWLSGSHRPGAAGSRPTRPTAGIIRLTLVPDGVLAHVGLQPGLWGETGAERERAHRALSRVQGILGPEAVLTAVLGGGRGPAAQAHLIPWGDERTPARPGEPTTWPVGYTSPEDPDEAPPERVPLRLVTAGEPEPRPETEPPETEPPETEPPDMEPQPDPEAAEPERQHGDRPRLTAVAGGGAGGPDAGFRPTLVRESTSSTEEVRVARPPAGAAAAPCTDGAPGAEGGAARVGGPGSPSGEGTPLPAAGRTDAPARLSGGAEGGAARSGAPAELSDGAAELGGGAAGGAVRPGAPAELSDGAAELGGSAAGGVRGGVGLSGAAVPGGGAVGVNGGAGGAEGGAEGLDPSTDPSADGAAAAGRSRAEVLPPVAGQVTGPSSAGAARANGGAGGGRASGRGSRRAVSPPVPPWPGRPPPPAPAAVLLSALPVQVEDDAGETVRVSARLAVSGPPCRVVLGSGRVIGIVAWTGPWPVDERWWAPAEARRGARFQVGLADGRALLLGVSAGSWHIEAVYD
ncbi:DNA polymerase Y family protein [Rhizomonospora bruguierae]|uniref:DNA polymerase Y family protein n=1 Tax=Rhizomonospora bruguierae TaxID=1581705 RepID=UPI0020BE0654